MMLLRPLLLSSICFAPLPAMSAYSSKAVTNEAVWLNRRQLVDLSLYLVANNSLASDEQLLEKIESAVLGGVSCVQLRDLDSPFPEKLERAKKVKVLLDRLAVPLIINSDLEIAHQVQAAGIHLEKSEPSYNQARELLGSQAIIGIAARNEEELASAQALDVDYISIKLFRSRTCPLSLTEWGLEGLKRAQSLSRHRLVAIGGIGMNVIGKVYQQLQKTPEMRHGIAMVGDLWKADNPSLVAKALLEAMKQSEED